MKNAVQTMLWACIVAALSTITTAQTQHAFLWTAADGMQDLGTVAGTNSYALGINASGQVVGMGGRSDGTYDAFRWTSATGMQDLGSLGGLRSTATAVNAGGQIVGRACRADGGHHGFLWTRSGGIPELGNLSSDRH